MGRGWGIGIVVFAAVAVWAVSGGPPWGADHAAYLNQAVSDFDRGYQLMGKAERYAEAEPYLRNAVQLARKAEDGDRLGYYQDWLVALYERWNREADIEREALLAYEIHTENGRPERMQHAASVLGRLYRTQGRYKQSETWYRRAIEHDAAAGGGRADDLYRELNETLANADADADAGHGPQEPEPARSESKQALLDQSKQHFDHGFRLMAEKRYDEAELYLLLAADAAREAGGESLLGTVYDALAGLYGKTGKQRRAMEMRRKALEARGETAAVRPEPAPVSAPATPVAEADSGNQALLAQARQDFGRGIQLMNREKHYAAAEPLLLAAVTAAEQAGDTHAQVRYLSELDSLYSRWEQPDKRARTKRRILTLHVGHENWERAASVADDLGYAYLERSEWGPAEDWFRKAMRYDFAAGQKTFSYRLNLGRSLMGADNLDGAEPVLREALQLALEEGNHRQALRVYDILARLYEKTGDYRREREARGKAHEIRETYLKSG